MHTQTVEIFSDKANAPVMRHPDGQFPGVLVAGDTLYSMCIAADLACKTSQNRIRVEDYAELNEMRNQLWGLLTHYKSVLVEHKIPFPEQVK